MRIQVCMSCAFSQQVCLTGEVTLFQKHASLLTRLIRHPDLKIIIGHFGEMLPFMLERCQYFSRRFDRRERSILDVWKKNIFVTTSGVWSLGPMRCLLEVTKIDHILFSVDWPFTTNEDGRKWFEDLEQSGMLSAEDLEKIAFKNAERLLKVKVPTAV